MNILCNGGFFIWKKIKTMGSLYVCMWWFFLLGKTEVQEVGVEFRKDLAIVKVEHVLIILRAILEGFTKGSTSRASRNRVGGVDDRGLHGLPEALVHTAATAAETFHGLLLLLTTHSGLSLGMRITGKVTHTIRSRGPNGLVHSLDHRPLRHIRG